MNAVHSFHAACHHRILSILWMVAWALAPTVSPAQIVGERIGNPIVVRPKALSIREASFSSITPKSEALYRKEAQSQTYVLESTEGETRHEWSFGGQARPLPEGAAEPPPPVERRVKFLAHDGKHFVKIELNAKGLPGQEEKEIRFSGVYEVSTLEGDWAAIEGGGSVKVKMLPADHERYLEQILRTFHGPQTLPAHSDKFRRLLIGILERKIAEPGDAPAAELDALRRIVASAKTRPETIAVAVAPSFTSDPEVFVLEGDTMRSTKTNQSLILRFKAEIHNPGPSATSPAKP